MKRKIRDEKIDLFTNFSDYRVTDEDKTLLNKAPNFVPWRKSVNKTEVKVSNFHWKRRMLWRQKFHGEQIEDKVSSEGEQEEESILKKALDKTNLPRGFNAPAELQNCIAATEVDILSSKLNRHCPNLS